MKKVLYSAIFLNSESVQKIETITGVKVNAENIHSTLTFMPNEDIPSDLLGINIRLRVIASGWYAENGEKKNFGLKIAESSLPDSVWDISKNAQQLIQHVTVAVINGGKAVDTAKCQWDTALDFEIEGTLGYCTVEEPSVPKFN